MNEPWLRTNLTEDEAEALKQQVRAEEALASVQLAAGAVQCGQCGAVVKHAAEFEAAACDEDDYPYSVTAHACRECVEKECKRLGWWPALVPVEDRQIEDALTSLPDVWLNETQDEPTVGAAHIEALAGLRGLPRRLRRALGRHRKKG